MFQGHLLSVRSPDRAATVAVLGLISALVTVGVGSVPVLGFVLVYPVVGLAVAAGALFGGVGAVVVAVGYLVGQAASGHVGVVALAFGVGHVTMGLVSAAVWNQRPLPDSLRRTVQLREFGSALAVTVGSAALAGGVVVAWGYEVFALAPFTLAAGLVLSFGLSGALVAGPVLTVFGVASGRELLRVPVGGEARAPDGGTRPTLERLVGIPLVWLVIGTAGSVGYRAIGSLLSWDADAFAMRGLDFLLLLYNDDLFGVGGRRAQAAFGGMMFVLLVLSLASVDGTSRAREVENG